MAGPWLAVSLPLLGNGHTVHQMTYDLRRLRLDGLIQRVPHTNTYEVTPEGIRTAVFFTKVLDRILRPLLCGADVPPASPELRRALATIDHVVAEHVTSARLGLDA